MRELVYRRAADRDLKSVADFIGERSDDLDAAPAFADPLRAQCAGFAASPFPLERYLIFVRGADARLESVNALPERHDLAAAPSSDEDAP